MKTYIHASAGRVWEAITDHAGLGRFSGVTSARLLRSGRIDPNGVGAQREVCLGRLRFVEDIVRFEPPHVFEYRVVECTVPFDHELGRIELIERGGGTELHWTTRFHIAIPVFGRILTRAARPLVCDGFYGMLLELKHELEGDSPN